MNKKIVNFLLSVSMILGMQDTLPTYASTYTDWGMRTAFVALAGGYAYANSTASKNLRLSVNDLIATGKFEVSQPVQEWIKEIARERGIKESVIDTVRIHTNITLGGIEQGMVIQMEDCLVLLIPLADVKKLESLFAKKIDDFTDQETNEYHKIKFMVGHEFIHIKRTTEQVISMARGDSLKLLLGFLLANWASYEILRYFSVDADKCMGLAGILHALSQYVIIQCVLSEEYDCDKRSSEDPLVIKAGVEFMEKDGRDVTIEFLTKQFFENSCEATEFYNSYKDVVEMMMLHPHPERRAACLAAYAQKLEQAQCA